MFDAYLMSLNFVFGMKSASSHIQVTVHQNWFALFDTFIQLAHTDNKLWVKCVAVTTVVNSCLIIAKLILYLIPKFIMFCGV